MQPDSIRAIVTGGVSGLGLAVATRIVADGGKVALFDVNDDKGAAAVAALGDANARYFRTDVTDEDGVVANVAAAKAFLGGLNATINCAGILGAGRVLGREAPMPLKNFSATVMVNLVGSFNVAKAAAAQMQHNAAGEDGERGAIVNTASVAGEDGQVGQAAYSASKGGVIGMTLPIARDLMNDGIRVNTILPGIFNTPLMNAAPQAVKDALAASVPFPKRLGHPEEYAQLALTMITCGYFNGEDVRLDGAIRMAPR
jgi:NAD(P)-dependent dehydrogenase (short-subunit alcohol dehydrogenase family)